MKQSKASESVSHLELCDSGVADLSSCCCIFTSVESFHFVVEFPNEVYLQRAGPCEHKHTGFVHSTWINNNLTEVSSAQSPHRSVKRWETTG